jgi:hypothetical protein
MSVFYAELATSPLGICASRYNDNSKTIAK